MGDWESGMFPFVVSFDAPENIVNMKGLVEAPAGRHGFVRVVDGHFATDKGRIRFNGVNLTGPANFPGKKQADRLGANLARLGVNCVRLHYMDADYGNFMQPPGRGFVDKVGDVDYAFRPGELDRLDYLVSRLKANGVYVDLNLHVARFMSRKGATWFDPALIASQKKFAAELLGHVNPYTGLAWRDEPAVAFVELSNEDAFMSVYGASARKELPEFVRFVLDAERAYLREMGRFLREEAGLKVPLTGTQVTFTPAYTQAAACDFIDYHDYWCHPTICDDWKIMNEAVVNWGNTDWCCTAFDASRRVLGKPFTVTEYGHPYPNAYGAEGQPLLRAYGAFQDWDAVFTYSWQNRHDIEPDHVEYFFSNGSRADVVAHMPAMAAMFLRGDVAKYRELIVVPGDERAYAERFYKRRYIPEDTQTASGARVRYEHGLVHGLALDAAGRAPMPVDLGRAPAVKVSDTGELIWNGETKGAGYVTLDTANVKLFTGFVRGRTFDLGGVGLAFGETRLDWATVTLLSKDATGFGGNGPARLLLAVTGLCRNKGAREMFTEVNDGMKYIATRGADWGTGPFMCEGVPLAVTLPVAAERVSCKALDERGDAKSAVPVGKNSDGRAVVSVDSRYETVWYEIDIA